MRLRILVEAAKRYLFQIYLKNASASKDSIAISHVQRARGHFLYHWQLYYGERLLIQSLFIKLFVLLLQSVRFAKSSHVRRGVLLVCTRVTDLVRISLEKFCKVSPVKYPCGLTRSRMNLQFGDHICDLRYMSVDREGLFDQQVTTQRTIFQAITSEIDFRERSIYPPFKRSRENLCRKFLYVRL